MGGLPTEIWYLLAILAVISVWLLVLKRPIYECMAVAYVLTIVMTQRFDLFGKYLLQPSTSSLFYAIVAFLMLAHLFAETGVVESIIRIVLALVGRFRGGAGYVSLLASTFMAALSGTGPGNVAATGVFTIPAMVKTGFPPALAATVEMSASSLGNIIPPSAIVIFACQILNDFLPPESQLKISQFWIMAWGVGLWFLLQRWGTLLAFCYYYRVTPLPPDQRPALGEALRQGWPALIVPLLIFLPLFVDFMFPELIAARLGARGQRAFTDSVLLFTPGVAAVYGLAIARRRIPGGLQPRALFRLFQRGLAIVVPVGATIYLAYGLALVLKEIGMDDATKQWFLGLGLSRFQLTLALPLFFMFLGMLLPGSSQIAIFGAVAIATFGDLGGNVVLLAALLPALTGAMEGMTPPLALCMYAAMGISGSGFLETSRLALLWALAHLVMSIVLLFGLLPILGLGR